MRIKSYLAIALLAAIGGTNPALSAASQAQPAHKPEPESTERTPADAGQLAAVVEQATALRLEGKSADAVLMLQKALAKRPDLAGYRERANNLYVLKFYAMAVEDYCRALKLSPRDKDLVLKRASSRLWAGDVLGSIDDYSDVLKLDSGSTEAYDNRAAAYINLGQYDDAMSDFAKAIQSAKDDKTRLASVYFHRGSTYWYEHKYKEALDDFGQVIKNGGDPAAYWNRGLANFLMGNKSESLADISSFIDAIGSTTEAPEKKGEVPVTPFVKPSHNLLPAHLLRAIMYFDLGKMDKGEEDFKVVLGMKEVSPSFKLIAHAGLNDLPGAIDDLTQELNERNEYGTFLTRSDLYFRSKLYDKALCDAGAAVSMKDSEAGGYCNRGEAYFGLKRYTDSLNDLNKAISLSKENTVKAEALYWRGQSYKAMDKISLAQSDMAESKKLGYDPDMTIQKAYIDMLIDGFKKQHELPVFN